MALNFAAVMPHGDCLIPGMGDDSQDSRKLRRAMQSIARKAKEAKLDTVVVATPHGIRVDGVNTVGISSTVSGRLGTHRLDALSDPRLAEQIIWESTQKGIRSAGVVLGGDYYPLPLDWGTFIPIWFLSRARIQPQIVVVCPDRDEDLSLVAELGESIGKAAIRTKKRVGFIASADQAHAHDQQGPYGFHPAAKEFDARIVEIAEQGTFEDWLKLDWSLIKKALPDSPWQLAMLAGLFRVAPFDVTKVTYGCPTYFGMMCVEFEKIRRRTKT